jgi:CRISPR-associated endonuclease Cas1
VRERALEVLETGLQWLALPDPPPWLSDLAVLRTLEARCAKGYFGAWVGLSLHFARSDVKRIPPHWLTIRERSSPLSPTGSGRHAVDPANAILNYAYGCLEAQARQALTVQGFDLAVGFLHADKPGRDSLVFDLMECTRGAVDDLVLDFLDRTTLHAASFSRAGNGGVRLHPQLARVVVAACRLPQDQLDEDARWLRGVLLRSLEAAAEATLARAPDRGQWATHHTPAPLSDVLVGGRSPVQRCWGPDPLLLHSTSAFLACSRLLPILAWLC